jgi:hypothetical protein
LQFDVVITNPPFQDTLNRKKTPHKLWIDFTLKIFERLLKPGGSLIQVSPASFASPSNKVLGLMTQCQTVKIRLGTDTHFPGVGSSFSDYWIIKVPNSGTKTELVTPTSQFEVALDSQIFYLPNDISAQSLAIHKKVMFATKNKLSVRWDYVTAHNIRRNDASPTLSEVETRLHKHPVLHTNRKIWWSTRDAPWFHEKKVMWSRSGYTKPFFDPGTLGGTDMTYFIPVKTQKEGLCLEHNLSLQLFSYIFRTARWSGFGNEKVFTLLPAVPLDRKLTDEDLFQIFGITKKEKAYIEQYMA